MLELLTDFRKVEASNYVAKRLTDLPGGIFESCCFHIMLPFMDTASKLQSRSRDRTQLDVAKVAYKWKKLLSDPLFADSTARLDLINQWPTSDKRRQYSWSCASSTSTLARCLPAEETRLLECYYC
jgi:hypothetical protein